jgi:parallel beta-helix repeat protein
VYNYALQVSDIGCIYDLLTDGGGTEIAYNLCHGSRADLSDGIYLDFGSSNFIVHHNVVWDSHGGLALNTVSRNNKVYNNTLVGNTVSVRASGQDGPPEGPGTELKNNIFTSRQQQITGIVTQNNLAAATDPQFVDRARGDFRLKPGSPAIDAGVRIPPYTDGFAGTAPDIGAYESGAPVWKAGAGQGIATIEPNGSGVPFLMVGAVALASVSVPPTALGTTVTVTDGAGIDRAAQVVNVLENQVTFVIPTDTVPGVAMVTIRSGDGGVSLGSAPIFDDRR